MAEIGSFRTGIGGFNKADVLNYIDELNAAHAAELQQVIEERDRALQEAQQQREQLEKSDEAFKQNADQLADLYQRFTEKEEELAAAVRAAEGAEETRRELEVLYRENRELKEKLDSLRSVADGAAGTQKRMKTLQDELEVVRAGQKAEAGRHADELRRLREQLEQERAAVRARDAELQALRRERNDLATEAGGVRQRIADLEKANRGYADLLGNVGAFILEIRSMGQKHLEESRARALACLDTMDDTVAALEQQLSVSRRSAEEARHCLEEDIAAAELRIQKWAEDLEKDAETVTAQKPVSEIPPDTDSGPGAADSAPHFFR